MKHKDVYEAECGDMMYYKESQKCERCKQTKKRREFTSQIKDEIGEYRQVMRGVCNKCREAPRGNTGNVSWENNHEEVVRPAIIDLAELYRERV